MNVAWFVIWAIAFVLVVTQEVPIIRTSRQISRLQAQIRKEGDEVDRLLRAGDPVRPFVLLERSKRTQEVVRELLAKQHERFIRVYLGLVVMVGALISHWLIFK